VVRIFENLFLQEDDKFYRILHPRRFMVEERFVTIILTLVRYIYKVHSDFFSSKEICLHLSIRTGKFNQAVDVIMPRV
jgi:hypothetical protein